MKQSKITILMSLVLMLAFVLGACAPAATQAPATEAPPAATEAATEEAPAATEAAPAADFTACQVTDAGGIDDRSFNATAWKGVQDAVAELAIEGKYLESQQQTDYEKNVNAFVEEGCDIIVTVGFLLGDATKAAAEANPDQKFSIVDFAYDPALPNVLGQVFATDQAGFLAGYAAAGVSKTGAVGTFGGIQIPTVTVFMDGYALGVQHYNEVHDADVKVLGWDPVAQTGLFTGNFESTDDGRTMGETLMDEGADVIMPVAGPVGLGTAAAAKERGDVYIVGVDSDWYETAPDYKDITLTSVMKFMDVTTFNAIQAAKDDTFEGGVTVGTLENEGVGLAPFHDLDSVVPAELKTELDQIKADIIAGTLATAPGATTPATEEAPAATEAAAACTEPKYTFGVSNSFVGSEWRTQMISNMEQTAEELCVELVIENADTDVQGQIQQINNLVNRGVDAIIINPGDVQGLNATLEDAVAQDIVVIAVDQEIAAEGVYNSVIDQKQWAKISAEWLAEQLGGEGDITLIEGFVGHPANEARMAGVQEVLDANPGLNVVGRDTGSWDPATAQRVAANFLASLANIDGMWTQDGMANGQFLAVEAANPAEWPVLVGEARAQYLHLWSDRLETDPDFQSIGVVNPPGVGSDGMMFAYQLLEGKQIDESKLSGPAGNSFYVPIPEVITNENLEEYLAQIEGQPDGYVLDNILTMEQVLSFFLP